MEDGISFKTSGSHLQDVECFSVFAVILFEFSHKPACMHAIIMTRYMMWGCIVQVKSRLKFTHTVESGLKLTPSVHFS